MDFSLRRERRRGEPGLPLYFGIQARLQPGTPIPSASHAEKRGRTRSIQLMPDQKTKTPVALKKVPGYLLRPY